MLSTNRINYTFLTFGKLKVTLKQMGTNNSIIHYFFKSRNFIITFNIKFANIADNNSSLKFEYMATRP